MRTVVFAGNALGAMGIGRLLDAGFELSLVFAQGEGPDEPAGSALVQEICTERQIPCVSTRDPNQFGWVERIRDARPDMLFHFAHRSMPRASILAVPKHGSFGLHPSLLPEYRCPDPVRRAILKGERRTGVTLHELVVEPYAGAVVASKEVEISTEDTALSLTRKIDLAADALLAAVLPRMRVLDFSLTPQDLSAGSRYQALAPEDGGISWDRPAREIHALVRAFTRPFSGAFGLLGDEMVFFWRASCADDYSLAPGAVAFQGESVLVGTGYGSLRPDEIEVNGRLYSGSALPRFFKAHEGNAFQ